MCVEGDFYSFKDIPYAEAPVGELRFQPAVPRTTVNRTVDDGSNSRICHQASGSFMIYSIALVAATIADQCEATPDPAAGLPSTNAPQSEDCLLLDVHVPRSVWKRRETEKRPVLFWIHGGGYTEGSKVLIEPAGQISRSLREDKEGLIIVTINYRLGIFGFPPNQYGASEVASNAALYDQRVALDWVQQNIHRFGGDPDQVTVIGESAGGGSIISQLAAFGGADGTAPFQRAILQSAGLKPLLDTAQYSKLYDQFLNLSGLAGYEDAVQLPAGELQAINKAMVALGPFADTVFSPNVDGDFIPDYPARLLYEGKLDQSVDLLVAHNTGEGVLFSDPRVQDDEGFRAFFRNLLPNLPEGIDALAQDVLVLAVSESLFDCHVLGLNLAYGNRTRGYLFDECPGLHAQDASYSLYNGETSDVFGLPIDVVTAETMQDWIVDFALAGTEPGSAARRLPVFGDEANIMRIARLQGVLLPKTDNSKRQEVNIEDDSYLSSDVGRDLKDQVLVFQHRGKFHAIDHRCPHSSYPLSKGIPFDIEDFGIVLSAGLTCPKHGWSFDVHSGMSDRGHYKLGVWEVQLRDVAGDAAESTEQEVWVRRKQRMG
ncbi:unnamed protein product [Parascedosporium putredinis]|uniref:Carboxylic ester hydrolase n=1 Tax=Parascedosporium putredinis TaxID=1442378 RepID=A0A9P1M8P2_9PEZI|nr:unnamed protein product [Parascedosporium putredinis]CAI7993094.1 unnamed protein product [Parascedosporium putredinis]